MGFLKQGTDDDPEQAQSMARIEAGGIPLGAAARLQALATDGSLFTSGLSVNEFALLDRLGPQPLAQVMGASVIRPGWQYLPALPPGEIVTVGPWYSSTMTGRPWQAPFTEPSPAQVRNYQWRTEVVCELDVLSDAWNTARRRALARLREEAVQVGADAIVGVHLRHSDHDLGRRTIDYLVSGTAIRLPESAGTSSPTLTDVSVQDYWRLRSVGHEPVGLVATTAVVFASPPRSTRLRRTRTRLRNQELEEVSRAFQVARETVRSRLLGQLSDAGGTGTVGVQFSHSVHRDKLALASSLQTSSHRGWQRGRLGLPYYVSGHSEFERRGWVITMHAAGTAIRRLPRPPESQAAPPEARVKTTVRMGSTE